MVTRINELQIKRDELNARLPQIENEEETPVEFMEEDIENVVKIIKEKLRDSDPPNINSFLKIFLDKITVLKDRVEIYYTFPQVDSSKVAFYNTTGPQSALSKTF